MAQLMMHRNILKNFHKLPNKVQKRVSELIDEFQRDPQSPAIGLHPLTAVSYTHLTLPTTPYV